MARAKTLVSTYVEDRDRIMGMRRPKPKKPGERSQENTADVIERLIKESGGDAPE